MKSKRKVWFAVVLTVVATSVVVLVFLNLVGNGKTMEKLIPPLYAVSDASFERTMSSVLGPAMLEGNQLTPLQNGDEIFPAMLEAIRSAKQTVNLESYIYWSGAIGRAFSDALSERARAGVRTSVILDWAGSKDVDQHDLAQMREAGAQVELYNPLRWYQLDRVNNRTHRKLLIVDGRIGFTGGVGIADKWQGHADTTDHWRDSHFRVEGPVVAQLQATFVDNWLKTRGELLYGPAYFPHLEPHGDVKAQVRHSSLNDGAESVRLMYLLSISAARRSILIANAYFIPDNLAVAMLVSARQRGVKVQILLPGDEGDSTVARHASRSRWGPLLEAGVEIFEYKPTMFHCKVMIVDGLWSSVGSTNFDSRSFRLNDEVNLNLLDAGVARALTAVFDRDRAQSRAVSLEGWRGRGWVTRFTDFTVGLVRAEL
jgi:cardiolipin synthase